MMHPLPVLEVVPICVFLLVFQAGVEGAFYDKCNFGFHPVPAYTGTESLRIQSTATYNNLTGEVTYRRRLIVGRTVLVGDGFDRMDILNTNCYKVYDAVGNFFRAMEMTTGLAVSPFPGENLTGRVDSVAMTIECFSAGVTLRLTDLSNTSYEALCTKGDDGLHCHSGHANVDSKIMLYNVSMNVSDDVKNYMSGSCQKDLSAYQYLLSKADKLEYRNKPLIEFSPLRVSVGWEHTNFPNDVKCTFARQVLTDKTLSKEAVCRMFGHRVASGGRLSVLSNGVEVEPSTLGREGYIFESMEELWAVVDVSRYGNGLTCRCQVFDGNKTVVVPLPLENEEYAYVSGMFELWMYLSLFVVLSVVMIGIAACIIYSERRPRSPLQYSRLKGGDASSLIDNEQFPEKGPLIA